MSIPLSFGTNNIQVYAFERFDFTIANPIDTSNPVVSNSPGLSPQSLYFGVDGSGNTRFRVTDLSSTLIPSSRSETFTVTVNTGLVSSNSVTINPGRFLDPSRNTLLGNAYNFFRNEAIRDTLGYPLRLVAPSFRLRQPTSVPTLPPGLSFVRVDSNIFDISGIPTVTVANTNYQLIGVEENGSKVVTSRINFVIGNERVRLSITDASINDMSIGTPITPRVLTAFPPQGSNTIRYTFPPFPDGIVVKDIAGIIRTSPIVIQRDEDPSYTLVLSGTPTTKAATDFRDGGTPSNFIQASRVFPLPLIESTQTLTFGFRPTVLFDSVTVPELFTGIPIQAGSIFFRAETYFRTGNETITSITAPSGLPSGLSLTPSGVGRVNLTETPTVASSASYTLRAVDSSLNQTDILVPITVVNDFVTFTTSQPSNSRFVLSRPLTQALPGFYESNIRFVAEAASKRPVTLSAPVLDGTGIRLDSNGFLTGTPTRIVPPSTLRVIASVTGSSVTAFRDVSFEVLDDVLTFDPVSQSSRNFIQNIPITPFQIPVRTLSGRNIIGYSQSGFPSGILISPSGIVSGTPLTTPLITTATVTATTGYASKFTDLSYTVIPDSILIISPQRSYTYTAGQSVSDIQFTGTSFSGRTISNYTITLPSPYGLTMSPGGIMNGTWTTSIPPDQVLTSNYNFDVRAQANLLTGTLPATVTASNILERTSFVWSSNALYSYYDTSNNDASWNVVQAADVSGVSFSGSDIVIKNSNVDGNTILAAAQSYIYRSLYATNFSRITITGGSVNQFVSKLVFGSRTNWWAAGSGEVDGVRRANLIRSIDNGLTWQPYSTIRNTSGDYLLTRDSNSLSGTNPYLTSGVALEFYITGLDRGVMMAGGISDGSGNPVMLRSTDLGRSWNNVSGGFAQETASFSLPTVGLWVATGSDGYKTISTSNYTTDTNTVKYSTDQGLTWTSGEGGFTMFGYDLVYANNIWVATGLDGIDASTCAIKMKYSTDAVNWSDMTLFDTDPYSTITPRPQPPLPIGSVNYDGTNWNVFVQDGSVTRIFSSPFINATPGEWTSRIVTSQFNSSPSSRFVSYTRPQYLRTTRDRTIPITLTFDNGTNGPTIDLETLSYLLYQYIPFTLQLGPVDPNPADRIYFFVSSEQLPPGLSFNPLTNTISGKPAQQGLFLTEIYAKNSTGVTVETLKFTVNIPRVIRNQDGAGAYTSLLKQYTEVLASQSARDNRVLPNEQRRLGEFMSPIPHAVITVINDTCPEVPSECPVDNEAVDAGGVDTAVCNFIDANVTTNVFDAGNAEANVCD